ncbi:MAG TPA: DUF2235 domain-containing protein [Thermohalobaculum sp.]|nr:DUF2235 domain-containing protein [Thermohalobaculum sp.]
MARDPGSNRNIVICYDGTGNEYGDTNTNVVRTFQEIVRDGKQVAFYDPGVGTFSYLGRKIGRRVGTVLGQAFGLGLVENLEDAYEYLMNTHVPGDNLYIFGFSRGAFQARVLADYVHKMGVLQKGSRNLIPYVTKLYFNERRPDVINGFRQTYCHNCSTHFLGVWDTVASLGHFFGRQFSSNILNADVKYAFQAAAIDEKRKKFPLSLWDESRSPPNQKMEQVWFAGVHSDIGGGYAERGLPDIAMAWLVGKAESEAGLRMREGWRDRLPCNPLGQMHESRAGFWKLWQPVVREVPEGSKVHYSVKQRMDDPRLGYVPKLPANFTWVDEPDDGPDTG